MNAYNKLILLLTILLCTTNIFGFNLCNVDIQEPWFMVNDSFGTPVLIVDSQGDVYFEGKDHTQNNQNSLESFELNNAHFNTVTSKFGTFTQEVANLPATTNSLIITSWYGINVTYFKDNGDITTIGKGAYQGSQGGCSADGLYCNGVLLENRDYYCDITGSQAGSCTHNVLSSEDCMTKLSTDTDSGIDKNTQGTVTDYTGCAAGACTFTTYTDSCTTATDLLEYSNAGSSYSTNNIDCTADNYYYCSGIDKYLKTYDCSGGACGFDKNVFIKTCNLAGGPSYSGWVCADFTTRTQIRTDYSNTCNLGACGISSVNVVETETAPANMHCDSGSWVADTFSWDVSGWGSCSVSCGGGTKTRTVVCRRDYDNAIVADSYCSGAKPSTSKSCNTQSCCSDTCSSLGYCCGIRTVCGVATDCGTCAGSDTLWCNFDTTRSSCRVASDSKCLSQDAAPWDNAELLVHTKFKNYVGASCVEITGKANSWSWDAQVQPCPILNGYEGKYNVIYR